MLHKRHPLRLHQRMIPTVLRAVLPVCAVLLASVAAAAAAEDPVLQERALGSPDAPVTIIEFSSLTCPHCATFHTDTLPQLREEYIDTGKVRLVFRDFPLDPLAMGAAMLAHCVEDDRYFGFLDALFRSQSSWAQSGQPMQELERLSRFAGMGPTDFQACLQNGELLQGLQRQAEAARAQYEIKSTPTFIIEGEKIEGAQPFESFKKVIDEKLGDSEDPKETSIGAPGRRADAEAVGMSVAAAGARSVAAAPSPAAADR